MSRKYPALDELNRDPLDPNKLLEVAQLFYGSANYAIAYHLLERASQITEHPEILRHLGLTLLYLAQSAGDDDFINASESVLMRAIEMEPENPDLQRALSVCALQLGRLDEAERLALMSLSAKPDQHDAQHTLALCAFYAGRWGEGFDLYEKHVDKPPFRRTLPKEPQAPYWDGTPGKKLLVIGEQGIGDEISFASMVDDAARDNNVTLWCDMRLEDLFRRSMPYAKVEGRRPTRVAEVFGAWGVEDFEARCLAASLGRHYRRRPSDFPRRGFLVASETLRMDLRKRLAGFPGKKVGIAWTGGGRDNYWHRRGLSLDVLKALTAIPGITWLSLQYEAPDLATEGGIIHLGDILENQMTYDPTAALVMELDAVVTVTTAIAHLCGALGKRAHVLVPERPRWWYGNEGSDHAWYSALTMHRQRDGQWPIEEVRAALVAELGL